MMRTVSYLLNFDLADPQAESFIVATIMAVENHGS